MEYTDLLFAIGRVLFGGFFVLNALNHFTQVEGMTGYAQSKSVPAPKLAVLGGGILLLIGGLGILLGAYVEWAVFALALFLVPVTFKMHAFWKETDPNMKMMQQVQFNKNMGLLGAALMLLMIPQPWVYSFGF